MGRRSINREAHRLAKEELRKEEIRRRAKERLPVLRERARTRRELKTHLGRRIFGV